MGSLESSRARFRVRVTRRVRGWMSRMRAVTLWPGFSRRRTWAPARLVVCAHGTSPLNRVHGLGQRVAAHSTCSVHRLPACISQARELKRMHSIEGTCKSKSPMTQQAEYR